MFTSFWFQVCSKAHQHRNAGVGQHLLSLVAYQECPDTSPSAGRHHDEVAAFFIHPENNLVRILVAPIKDVAHNSRFLVFSIAARYVFVISFIAGRPSLSPPWGFQGRER